MIPTRAVRITDERLGHFHRFWTSLEGENPSGSIKDRMVEPELLAIKDHVATVAEISAGSTALSISYYAHKYKLPCRLFVPKGVDALIKKMLITRGASVTECDPATAYEFYNDYVKQSEATLWPFGQMTRKELQQHYTRWAERDLEPHLPPIDYVIGTVGTGHSLSGIAEGLKPGDGVISVEPLAGTNVSGIRNVVLQNFGANDPWRPSSFASRVETALSDRFAAPPLETDLGPIYVSDSFKLALEGLLKINESWPEPKNIFIVGSHCRRINGVKNS